MMNPCIPLAAVCGLALAAPPASALAASDWPQWRGPDGTGMAVGDAPSEWAADKNVKWKVEIPGRGCSTPIVLGDRIFVTTAVPLAAAPEAAEDEKEFHEGGGAQPEHSFEVHCLERATGKTVWKQVAVVATPHEGFHRQYGSHASASPVSDGERLYVSFGSRGVYSYDLDGKLIWKRDFGVEMEIRRQFGEGTAPVVAGDALVLNFDHEGPSFLVVVDRKTGEDRWRVERDEPTTWASPLVVEVDGESQVVVTGTNRVRAYDLASGKVVWECGGLGVNCIPTPVRFENSVIVMSGYKDPRVMAIELGHEGDLTGTDAVLWQNEKGTCYTPSPVLAGTELYALTDRGFLSAFDVGTGEPFYLEERMPRGLLFKAAPIGVGDRLYALAETGEMAIIRMGPELEVITTVDSLEEDEMFLASPVAVDGELFLRSVGHLYCLRDEG